MGLENKIAIVSGGSRGIGKEVVISLAKQGAKVAFTYLNNIEAAEQVLDTVRGYDSEVKAYKVDVRNYQEVKQFIANVVSSWKRIDVLVNNAGIRKDKSLLILQEGDWNDVIQTNLTGVFNLTKTVGFYMVKNKSGRIVNVSSVSGIYGIAGQTNYSSSKAGMIGLTKAFAKEVAKYGVSVNVVAPGGVDTDMVATMPEKEKTKLIADVPMGRLGTVEEISKAILFLCDNEASPDYLTGSVININGGIGI